MPYTDVEWTNGDTVDESKLNQMMENLDVIRAEQYVQRLVSRPWESIAARVSIPSVGNPPDEATVRARLNMGGINSYSGSWTEPPGWYSDHAWTSFSIVNASLGVLTQNTWYFGHLEWEVTPLGGPTTHYRWHSFHYYHTPEYDGGRITWRCDMRQYTVGGTQSTDFWNANVDQDYSVFRVKSNRVWATRGSSVL